MKLGPLLVLAVLLIGCPPAPRPLPPSRSATCAEACSHARTMHCELGNDTPKGASCETVCKDVIDGGNPYPTGCIATAQSCDEADACR